jgi:predicted nucleotidyltransferase
MYPNQTLIDELIRRIVGTVHPLHIVLFGSAARGEMRPDSDIDVLIVMPEGAHRRRTAQDIEPPRTHNLETLRDRRAVDSNGRHSETV